MTRDTAKAILVPLALLSIVRTFCNCRLAGANFNPGTYHPEGSVIGSYALPLINAACIPIPTLHSCWLPVGVMSLVSQPDLSTCSDEQHNVEVQDKIDTEQDNEIQ